MIKEDSPKKLMTVYECSTLEDVFLTLSKAQNQKIESDIGGVVNAAQPLDVRYSVKNSCSARSTDNMVDINDSVKVSRNMKE